MKIDFNQKEDKTFEAIIRDNGFELSGTVGTQTDGRRIFLSFEPSWLLNDESEKYYEEHWEEIDAEIDRAHEPRPKSSFLSKD